MTTTDKTPSMNNALIIIHKISSKTVANLQNITDEGVGDHVVFLRKNYPVDRFAIGAVVGLTKEARDAFNHRPMSTEAMQETAREMEAASVILTAVATRKAQQTRDAKKLTT